MVILNMLKLWNYKPYNHRLEANKQWQTKLADMPKSKFVFWQVAKCDIYSTKLRLDNKYQFKNANIGKIVKFAKYKNSDAKKIVTIYPI